MWEAAFLMALASPVHSSAAGAPKEVLNEIARQQGEYVRVEKREEKYIYSLWLGTLYLQGIFELAGEKKTRLVIYGVSHAKRLNLDNTVAFEWSAPGL